MRWNCRRLLVVVLSLSLSPACLERTKADGADSGEAAGTPTESDTDADSATLVVSSMALRFSEVPLHETATQTLTLSNAGDDDIQLFDLSLIGPTTFGVGPLQSPRLAPGESTSIDVRFAPLSADEQHGSLVIESSAPGQAEVSVELVGQGVGGVLAGPAALEFAPIGLGCAASAELVVSNAGNAPLTVSSASSTAPFSVETGLLPLELAPDEETLLTVWYEPTLPSQPTSSHLLVSSDAGDVTVPLSGAVTDVHTTTESFEAMGAAADVVLSVDTSRSMDPNIDSIVAALPSLTAALDDRGADWRVSVVAEDDGCVDGPDLFIDDSFSPADVREAAAAMFGMTSWYNTNQERAFMLMEAGLDAASSGGCNAGLLRDPATLQLVAVSDEAERSVEATSYYVGAFQGIKADPSDVAVHAIGPCTAGADTQRYEDAAAATGGHVYSICDNLDASFDALARSFTLSGPTVYPLQSAAVPDTLSVQVDGVPRSDWRYAADTRIVSFDAATAPDAGETVDITYVPDACP